MWVWLVMPVCAIVLVAMWLIFGKDKKTIPTITVSPPEGLDPLEMEYAQIVTISDRGIFAMLLYWVSKGWLEIRTATDAKAGNMSDDTKDDDRVGVEKVADLPQGQPDHAYFLFERLFKKSDLVWLDSFPPEVSDHKGELRDKVAERFTGRNAVVESDTMNATMAAMFILIIGVFVVEVMVDAGVYLPSMLAVLLFCMLALLQNGALGFRSKYDTFEVVVGGIGAAAILAAHLLLLYLHAGAGFTILFAVCFLICVPCIMFMERRVNHRLYGQILGFRQFIETAEWEKLKLMSEEDPQFGMDILPYAMLFNMGTKWTKNFENKTIYTAVEKMEKMSSDEK